MNSEIDYAVRQYLHKRFIPRHGVDRVGRRFSEIPDDEGRYESIRGAQSLFVNHLIVRYANPCDDVFEVEADNHKRCVVRVEWLRLYWREAGA